MTELMPLQHLTFAKSPVPATAIGDRGELVWLPLSKLRIDTAYQRAILDAGKANIRRMVEAFSWLQFGAIIVARRKGGVFAIIDGQHRATAALIHGGIDQVPCLVLTGGTEAEARAFSAINGNVTRVHPLQSFRALVAAGDPDAKAVLALCADAHVTIVPYPRELKAGETQSLNIIRQCLRRHGDKVVRTAMMSLRLLDDTAGLGGPALNGCSSALYHRPDLLPVAETLAAKIAAPGKLAALSKKALERKAARGGTEWSSFGAVLIDALTMAQRTGGQDLSRLMAGR
jgi:hypothetical protein